MTSKKGRASRSVVVRPGAFVRYVWGLDNTAEGRVVSVYGPKGRRHVIVEDDGGTRSIPADKVLREVHRGDTVKSA